MTLVNRMSKVVLMPECGDLVVRSDGSKYVVTGQSFDDDTCAMSLVRSQAEHPATRDQLTQLGVAADDQLHAEWLKRHPNQVLTAFGGVSDDQLRAECERRFGPDYTNGLPRVREANLIDERDAVIAERDGAHRAVLALTRERDEWKRRAEAAEDHLADARDGEISDDVVRAEYTRRFMVTAPANELDGWRKRAKVDESVLAAQLADAEASTRWPTVSDYIAGLGPAAVESAPGIAAMKPDTARWGPSDEDLLADDVEPKR